jgi:hypothetical protein
MTAIERGGAETWIGQQKPAPKRLQFDRSPAHCQSRL